MKDNDELKLDIVESLARKEVVGGHKKQVDTVKNWFKASDQGRIEDLIRELSTDPNAPVIAVGGGARDTVQLTSIPDAKKWLKERGRDLWWL
jgi:soluble P-type ATPase